MNIAKRLDRALRAAGIPIVGVSIGTDADRASWIVHFGPGVTAAQQTQAATLLAGLTLDETAEDRLDAQGQIEAMPLALKAVVLAVVDQMNLVRAALPIPLPALTPAQVITAIKTKASTLS